MKEVINRLVVKSVLDRDKLGNLRDVVCYIILAHDGTYYCGITNSIIRRWKEHVSGKSKYLKFHRPKEVVYLEWFEGYSLALKKERQIKNFGVWKVAKKSILLNKR